MSRLFLGNFEFEHQLAGDPKAKGFRAASRIVLELCSVWQAIARGNDAIWMPGVPEADFASEMADQGLPKLHWLSSVADLLPLARTTPLTLCPWGWSREATEWAERCGLSADPTPFDAVCQANSRRLSFQLECELNAGLPGSMEIATLKDCLKSLASFGAEDHWVIKSEFGMSGRERLVGRGPTLSSNQQGWAVKRLGSGRRLFLEPWVESLGEAGLEFEVPRPGDGEPYCVGVAPMLTDKSGTYRGSRFDSSYDPSLDWSKAVETGLLAAKRIQSLGYFGPLGIDAMWYLDHDQIPKLRQLQDINARWTMGRLSLGFRSLLAQGDVGAFVQLRSPAQTLESAREWWHQLIISLPREARLLRLSPLTLGGQVTRHASAVLMASNEESLRVAIEKAISMH